MRRIQIEGQGDFDEWRNAARALVAQRVWPDDVAWLSAWEDPGLFGEGEIPVMPENGPQITVPRSFAEAAEAAICHSDENRFPLLYRLLWRLQSKRGLMQDRADRDVAELSKLVKSVRRDSHKMKAFVRFKELESGQGGRRCFAAWFEPDHFIVARTAPFFARRFADMDWLIATPKGSASWDGENLSIDPTPATKLRHTDEADELWRIYFSNIFNPARLKVKAMQAEMPKKYWKNLPEASLIPELIASAEDRVRAMAAAQPTPPPAFHDRLQAEWEGEKTRDAVTPTDAGAALAQQISACQRCPLHGPATQAVCGEGPLDAEIMLIGEQPGDREDLAGRPFIGPAGQVLNEGLSQAGLERDRLYLTNAVKHFKYEPRGKRRLHKRPDAGEVRHCRWWLEKEFELVRPKIVVALGATAYQALTGETKPMEEIRGMPIPVDEGRMLFVTVHPAYILRIPEPEKQAREKARFHEDLQAIVRLHAASQAA
ncbi:MAG: uracil-DNA glycosylase [Hoeflea sp.]|nr:uracil-DNA glycosylase [Hoeflea sp.]|tara:strand:- start:5100 stop:6557 length:1458 start_codon:yes stop_codon:yes gene_type:complete